MATLCTVTIYWVPDWLLSDGCFKGRLNTGSDVNELLDSETRVSDSLALTVATLVGVLGFGGDSIIDHVLEGVIHESTLASLILVDTSSAVDEFLFREDGELFVSEEDGSFEGSGGGEGPAGSA